MANTYSKIYLHIVFAVKHRASVIQKPWKDELYKYITGIVKNEKQIMYAINGVEDHIHMLIAFKPNQSISELVQSIKSNSSRWINQRSLVEGKFEWQGGFGVFSCSSYDVSRVVEYIENQEMHHKRTSFRSEYVEILKKSEVEYEEKYLFNDLA